MVNTRTEEEGLEKNFATNTLGNHFCFEQHFCSKLRQVKFYSYSLSLEQVNKTTIFEITM